MRSAPLFILVLLFCGVLQAQSLSFIGLPEVSFGMKLSALPNHQLIMDTSSAYNDTALYIANTRCIMYYQQNQNLHLKGFDASRIEYEFCDSALGYVFIYVSGKENLTHALDTLKAEFKHLGCGKNTPLTECTLMDAHNRKMRVIIRVNPAKNEMNFVLIPRKAAQ